MDSTGSLIRVPRDIITYFGQQVAKTIFRNGDANFSTPLQKLARGLIDFGRIGHVVAVTTGSFLSRTVRYVPLSTVQPWPACLALG